MKLFWCFSFGVSSDDRWCWIPFYSGPFCNTPIFNISLFVLLLDDVNINIINTIDLFDVINLIIHIY